MYLHADMKSMTSRRASIRSCDTTDFSALQAPEILKTFKIRPVGLLFHVLAGLKFMDFHASIKSMTFRPWCHRYLNSSLAASFLTVSCTSSTSTRTVLLPNWISRISPAFTWADALAGLPLISTRPASQASFATVLLLIRRDTFKYLSSLIFYYAFTKSFKAFPALNFGVLEAAIVIVSPV